MLRATLRGVASALPSASTLAASSAMGAVVVVGARNLTPSRSAAAAAVQPETPQHVINSEEGCKMVLDRAELDAEMLDVEMDRDEGPEFAVYEGIPQAPSPRAQLDPLGRPCDLEFEFDRDDPEAYGQEEIQTHRPQGGPGYPREHGVGAGEKPQYVHGRDSGPKYEDTI